MVSGQQEHPLATTTTLAAFTAAALFWVLGVSMIDSRTALGILLCIIGIATTVWLFWAALRNIPITRAQSWPWVGIVLLLLEIGVPAYMLYARADQPNKGTASIPASLDQTVQFTCEWSQLPTVVPQHRLYELQLIQGMGGGAFTSYSQQPGATINMANPDAPTYAYRCRFSNLGTTSLVNVATEMSLFFMESVKSGDGTKSGAVIATHKVDTPLITLGAGQIFDFYVRNYSAVYANMTLPTIATGQAVGSDQVQTFKLIPSQLTAFGMPPFDRSEPPKAVNVPVPVRRPVHSRSAPPT